MTARTVQIARSFGMIGATGALILGATFAAIGDSANVQMTGNTLSATAGLQIAPDVSGGPGTYGTTITGFQLTDMRFGVERTGGNFFLKSTSAGPQAVTVNVPSSPVITGTTADKVHVHIKKGATTQVDTTLDLLEAPAGVPFVETVPPGASNGEQYTVAFKVDGPTGNGVSVSVPSFDLSFTGTEIGQ